MGFLGEPVSPVPYLDCGVTIQYPEVLFNYGPFQRRFPPKLWYHLIHHLGVKDAAHHILAAGVLSPFKHDRLQAGLGQQIGSGQPRWTRTDNNDIKSFIHWPHPS